MYLNYHYKIITFVCHTHSHATFQSNSPTSGAQAWLLNVMLLSTFPTQCCRYNLGDYWYFKDKNILTYMYYA